MDAFRFANLVAKVGLPVVLCLVLGGPLAGFVCAGLIGSGLALVKMTREARAASEA